MTGLNKNQLVLLFDLLDHNVMGKIGLNDFCITVCILKHEEPPAQPTAPTHPCAAACVQEAPGAWYFLQARPERGHLYSLDTSTVWYSMYSFKAGNQRS